MQAWNACRRLLVSGLPHPVTRRSGGVPKKSACGRKVPPQAAPARPLALQLGVTTSPRKTSRPERRWIPAFAGMTTKHACGHTKKHARGRAKKHARGRAKKHARGHAKNHVCGHKETCLRHDEETCLRQRRRSFRSNDACAPRSRVNLAATRADQNKPVAAPSAELPMSMTISRFEISHSPSTLRYSSSYWPRLRISGPPPGRTTIVIT
jgi:hypothetical protein